MGHLYPDAAISDGLWGDNQHRAIGEDAETARQQGLRIILNQLRKGTYSSKKVETLTGSDFALSFSNSSFSLRECFAHALTVGWDALDESASNELLNFALTIG